MKKNIKYQSKLVTVPAATTSSFSENVTLDSGYGECTGVAVHLINDGGITDGYFTISLKDDNFTYHNPTSIDNYSSDASVPPNQKFKDINIPVTRDQQLEILTGLPAAPGTDLKYEVVFRLEKKVVAV